MKLDKKVIRKFRVGFILGTAIVLLVTILILFLVIYILIENDVIISENVVDYEWLVVLLFVLSSVIIGSLLSFIYSRIVLAPINKLLNGMSRLTHGDYDTRVSLDKYESMKDLQDSFNNLANELQNIEILRSDFINNFSHELKTPIVSISGLVKLMRSGKLSEEKEKEYLAIIEEEIERLSSMTTNVLTLSKIENQSILRDKIKYNISEQIRTCIVLLEKKWSRKNLDLVLDFDEYYIEANNELMKQVFINLIDNAIKFSFDNKELVITILEKKNSLVINIIDEGVEIQEENIEKIFNKFYQVDGSEFTEGNGIGLSIVKHIVELHNGKITAFSKNNKTTFTIELPKQ